MSKLFKGKPSNLSKEQREKLAQAARDYQKKFGNPMQDKKHTKEARKKITKANLKRDIRGKTHYLFKGSKASNPRGEAWDRKKKKFLDERRLVRPDGILFCECDGKLIYDKVNDLIVHHLVNTKKIIDTVQDINYKWNLMVLCRSCHAKIHARLRGCTTYININDWNNYVIRHNLAVRKMKKIIKEVKDVS